MMVSVGRYLFDHDKRQSTPPLPHPAGLLERVKIYT